MSLSRNNVIETFPLKQNVNYSSQSNKHANLRIHIRHALPLARNHSISGRVTQEPTYQRLPKATVTTLTNIISMTKAHNSPSISELKPPR